MHLPEHELWLDPQRGKPLAFVSHAHGDHIARHREVLMTAATARFMRELMPGRRTEIIARFGEAHDLDVVSDQCVRGGKRAAKQGRFRLSRGRHIFGAQRRERKGPRSSAGARERRIMRHMEFMSIKRCLLFAAFMLIAIAAQ